MNRLFVTRIGTVLAAGVVALLQAGVSVVLAEPQSPAPPSVVGLWEQVDNDGRVGSWFRIYESNGVYMGDIVKMFVKPGDQENPICTKCAGDQKNQPTIGLTLIKGMQRKGLYYENGSILDPRDGSVYQARMELSPDGRSLTLRGFVGIALFGQSQTWRRLPDSAMAEIESRAGPATAGAGIPRKPLPPLGAPAASTRAPAPVTSGDKGGTPQSGRTSAK